MKNKPFSPEELAQLAQLETLPDDEIDTSDIPETSDESWKTARRLYKPVKQPVTIRLDGDVVAWFKERAQDGGYQSEINRVLRHHMLLTVKRSA